MTIHAPIIGAEQADDFADQFEQAAEAIANAGNLTWLQEQADYHRQGEAEALQLIADQERAIADATKQADEAIAKVNSWRTAKHKASKDQIAELNGGLAYHRGALAALPKV